MTFWLDAQLDPELAPWMGVRFKLMVKHLVDVGLERASDDDLYAAARRFRDIVIVSKDADFAQLSRRLGPPPQIVHLRCGNLGTLQLQSLLATAFPDVLARIEAGEALVELAGP